MMEEVIREQIDGANPEEILELILDGCPPINLSVLEPYVSLRSLSLTENKITSFEGLPALKELNMLDLTSNELAKGFELLVEKCPNLTYLDLSENPIENMDELKGLANLKFLESLQLDACPIADNPNYRQEVFSICECLISLDGLDAHGAELESSEDFDEDLDVSSDKSDTHLSILLGDDIPSELDDSEFQMDDSAVKDDQPAAVDSSTVVDDESVEESGEVSTSNSTSKSNSEKRTIADSFDAVVTESPTKRPKV
uniref:Acidic leucine-rich nuclear phosphoprotein 32 family member n=1 Tax=Salmo salar TaxID=8030 RepID=B5X5A9_SALSA|nr:Acidic leucine-rich nuclear phosphoprotein 32 family member E [Salmo salar]ACI66029.1 Acidic leucine-rich nuclear phosphoprotein 32 family member E [Salmo salar]